MNPENLETILKFEGDNGALVNLQCDRKNHLYINNQKVITEKKIKLRRFELILAIIGTLSVVLQTILDFLRYIK